ncbi:hypothetical protein AC579_4471 [Pseudocercospora musae]|uniref:Uncharacterized protein n=1 Tax=Pseudocercospora musae TaxID=113226 RepID=A0A139GTS5_9PEZI|nr:hypothetical protein AC579_4471 [Pseudocercospora musae]
MESTICVGKRQAAASQTYNFTFVYATNAGSLYTLSAYVAQAQNADVALGSVSVVANTSSSSGQAA